MVMPDQISNNSINYFQYSTDRKRCQIVFHRKIGKKNRFPIPIYSKNQFSISPYHSDMPLETLITL